jgi:hypothetical protein
MLVAFTNFKLGFVLSQVFEICPQRRILFDMSKPRCSKCRAITSKFALSRQEYWRKEPKGKWRAQTIVWDSFESLDESARRGCPFCALVFQHLVYWGADYAWPISLAPSIDDFSINFGFRGGTSRGSGTFEWCRKECKKRHHDYPVKSNDAF